jgi:hypothetical protein
MIHLKKKFNYHKALSAIQSVEQNTFYPNPNGFLDDGILWMPTPKKRTSAEKK